MNIESFVVILSSIAGLIVAIFTAFITYIIIGEPIGNIMLMKIVLTILSVLPVIGLLSFLAGNNLSKKFKYIELRLEKIKNQKFHQNNTKQTIKEVNEINENINFLNNQLESLIGDLKQKNQNLSNLLISISHDIKTPLTVINGYIEEIEDGLITKKDMPDTLKTIKSEVTYLNELTVDMLEFISSMKKDKNKEEILLYDFINDEVFPLLPKEKKLDMLNDLHKDFIIGFNKIDLKKICLNIFINAIKYTDKGYIKIYSKDDKIYFENNGEEIKDEYKDKIFDPFFTSCISKNRKSKNYGVGLGLSIVSNLSSNNNYKCVLEISDKEKTIFSLSYIN